MEVGCSTGEWGSGRHRHGERGSRGCPIPAAAAIPVTVPVRQDQPIRQRHEQSLRLVALERRRELFSNPRGECPTRTLFLMLGLADEELDALVEEATVDAYGDEEQLGGFAVMIEDNLELPFETTVLGMTVTVQKIIQTDSGIVADCVRDGHHQAISVLDLLLPEPPPEGAKWIAAYRHWAAGR